MSHKPTRHTTAYYTHLVVCHVAQASHLVVCHVAQASHLVVCHVAQASRLVVCHGAQASQFVVCHVAQASHFVVCHVAQASHFVVCHVAPASHFVVCHVAQASHFIVCHVAQAYTLHTTAYYTHSVATLCTLHAPYVSFLCTYVYVYTYSHMISHTRTPKLYAPSSMHTHMHACIHTQMVHTDNSLLHTALFYRACSCISPLHPL